MEEVNEIALSEIVNGALIGEEYTLQGKGFSQEEIKEIDEMKLQNRIADINNISIKGKNLKRLRELCSHKPKGVFEECVQEYWGMKLRTAQQYERAYQFLLDVESCDEDARARIDMEKIKTLGVRKMDALYGIPNNIRTEVLEKAPINEMGYRDVAKLSTTVKEAGEYNEELLKEVQQKDQTIKISKEQQEKQQQTIQELQAKIQELQAKEVQPVVQVEPQIVEKIVEVEKVVEKEVVPEELQNELIRLRKDNKFLEEDNSRKTNFINKQAQELIDKQKAFDKLKMNEEQSDNYVAPNFVNVGILLSTMDTFIKSVAGYTFLNEQYDNISYESRKALVDGINSIRQWCNAMENTLNTININSENIIIEEES